MAVSAFKSTTRRPNQTTNGTTSSSSSSPLRPFKKDNSPLSKNAPPPPRRSRSVSAFSRNQTQTDDFLNKRDNPLFWSNDSPPDNEKIPLKQPQGSSLIKSDAKTGSGAGKDGVFGVGDERRGRSVSRNSGVVNRLYGDRKETGRSVSTTRRGRSVSQRPVSRAQFVSSESEVEQQCNSLGNHRNSSSAKRNVGEKVVDSVGHKEADVLDQIQKKNLRTWSSQHPPPSKGLDDSASNLSFSHSSVGSLSGVEEKTIKAVHEQMKLVHEDHNGDDANSGSIYETVRSEVRRAISDIQSDLENAIRRSNSTAIASSNVTDIPLGLVNPGAVELVMDIRSEYARKLEESQERARKLRADLAVEEHRGLELTRILKEVLPDPRTSTPQKSRPSRKASIERRRMSKRLTEEAMAYFDECVSLSTFDSSDLSSAEDPPPKLFGDLSLDRESGSVNVTNSNASFMHTPNSGINTEQGLDMDHWPNVNPELLGTAATCDSGYSNTDPASSQSTNLGQNQKHQFSFKGRPSGYSDFQQDIKKYVKSFENNTPDGNNKPETVKPMQYNVDEYKLNASIQSLLFDRVIYKNRLESGSMLLCGGVFGPSTKHLT